MKQGPIGDFFHRKFHRKSPRSSGSRCWTWSWRLCAHTNFSFVRGDLTVYGPILKRTGPDRRCINSWTQTQKLSAPSIDCVQRKLRVGFVTEWLNR